MSRGFLITKRIFAVIIVVALLLPCLARESAAVSVSADLLYGRGQLAAMSNGANLVWAYDALVSGVRASASDIVVSDKDHPLTESEWKTVYDAFTRDHGELYWGLNGCNYRTSNKGGAQTRYVTPNYMTAIGAKQSEFENAVTALYNSAGITSSMGEYEKALRLHDALCKAVTYVSTSNSGTSYGAIVEGKAVCEGYAKAYQTLLYMAGIQSYVLSGTDDTGGRHAWNLVRIEGQYYHTDVTWDDQDGTDGEAIISYSSFCITTATLKETRQPDSDRISIPDCTATDANYYTVNGGRMGNPGDIDALAKLFSCSDTIRVYITGSNWEDFFDWFADNSKEISQKAGFSSITGVSAPCIINREYVLKIKGTRAAATATKAPVSTPTKAATKAPTATATKTATAAATKTPTATKKVTATKTPTVTKTPTTTKAPTVTGTPTVTETPTVTPSPSVTEAPAFSSEAECSDIPPASEAPESSEQPSASSGENVSSPEPTPDTSSSDPSAEEKKLTDIPLWIPIGGAAVALVAVVSIDIKRRRR